MLLTIGMMVKNEEKNLKECLEALTPIREALDSELVIVDTGSDDNTVEIAKQFTDKVYFHEWNDNFSEMRNTVISYAKGDWYFSLDGDEVVNNPEGFIDFFKSGRYKKFKTALVTQKNYTDVKNNKFSSLLVPRVFKNDDFHFEGAIHNQPQYKHPINELDTILDHYGYISSDAELMEKKFQRTATILKDELEKDPENIYYWFQLSRSYAMHGDSKEALDSIINAYKIVKKKKNNPKAYMNVYIQLAKMYLRTKNYGKVEEIAKKAIKIKEGYLDIYYYLAKSQYFLNKKKDSLQSFKKYIEIINDYDNSISKRDTSVSDETISSFDFAYKYIIFLSAELKTNYNYALNKVFTIKKQDQLKKIINPFIDICIDSKNYNYLKRFFLEKAKNNKIIEIEFLKRLESKRINLDKKVEIEINEVFANSNDDSDYICLNKVRNAVINNLNDIPKIKINNINFNKKPNYFGDMIYYILLHEKDEVYNILSLIPENNLNKFIKYLNLKYDDLAQVLLDFIDIDVEKITEIRLQKSFCRYLIAFDNDIMEDDNIVINRYIDAGTKYIQKLYKKDIIESELITEPVFVKKVVALS